MTVGFDREVIRDSAGRIEWSTGRCRWAYHAGNKGLNLLAGIDSDELRLLIHAATPRDAAMFAEGYEAGFGLGDGPNL